ncbi:MAG: hypothetical protein KGL95_06575, partial [Patescibacteria group bacterium]|nr:hypothetical protein [Patescibacteria group bacterium]
MNKLPIFVIQLIQDFNDTLDQISFQRTNRILSKLKITILTISHKLNDDIVLKYVKQLHTLNAYNNSNITDKSIIKLKQLHTLNASSNPNIT